LLILQERFARDIADIKKITSVIITAAFFAASGMSPALAQGAAGPLPAGMSAGAGAGGIGIGALGLGFAGVIAVSAAFLTGTDARQQTISTTTTTSTTGLP
jgi:hypothetical protein